MVKIWKESEITATTSVVLIKNRSSILKSLVTEGGNTVESHIRDKSHINDVQAAYQLLL